LVLVVLVCVLPTQSLPTSGIRRGLGEEALDGLRIVVRDPVLRVALLLVAGSAGFILPVGSLLVPVLSRAHGWGASTTGLIVGAQALGAVSASFVVVRRGAHRRPGQAAAVALSAVGMGEFAVGLASAPVQAIVGALLMGVGMGAFVGNLSPLLLASSPSTHLARVQAILTLVQSVALLVTNTVLGILSAQFSVKAALLTCALAVLTSATVAWWSPSIRMLKLPLGVD